MNPQMNQKNLSGKILAAPIAIISLVILIAIGTYLAYAIYQSKQVEEVTAPAAISEPSNSFATSNNSESSDISGEVEPATQSEISETTAESVPSDETIDWQTYTSDQYKFNFQYPTDWTINSDEAITQAKLYRVGLDAPGITKAKHVDTDLPYSITVESYNSISDLDSQKLDPANLKDYLDKYSQLRDPVMQSVSQATVGNQNGYKAKAGPNQFGGGIYYYVQVGQKVFKIWLFKTEDSNTSTILSTFKFVD